MVASWVLQGAQGLVLCAECGHSISGTAHSACLENPEQRVTLMPRGNPGRLHRESDI